MQPNQSNSKSTPNGIHLAPIHKHSQSQYDAKKRTDTMGNTQHSFSTMTPSGLRIKTEGQGFSQFVGSSSLQHYSPNYSIPKQERFKTESSVFSFDPTKSQLLQLPSQQDQRGPSLGFGKKYFYPQHTMKNARENPSPSNYFISDTSYEQQEKLQKMKRKPEFGKSFGISFESYRSVYVPNQNSVSPMISKQLPGVGSYNVSKASGKDKLSYSMYGPWNQNLGTQYSYQKSFPSPNKYSPNYNLTEQQRFGKISMGKGQKYDFTKVPTRKNPSPQDYDIPSAFDKYNTKHKIQKQQMMKRRIDQRQIKTEFY